MKTYRDLYIHLNGVDLETLSKHLDHQCKTPWRRREDREIELETAEARPLCFEAIEGASVAPAALYIFPKEGKTWWVSNIVPTEANELSYDEYNAALKNFYESIVLPAIEGTAITAELTSSEIGVGSVAGDAAENALVRFSNLANKSTGSSHPRDRERWFEFLVLAHEAKADLHADLVIRTLIELGWSEERAIELGLQFEFAEALLSYVKER